MPRSKVPRVETEDLCGRGLRPRLRMARWTTSSCHAASASETPPTAHERSASIVLRCLFIAVMTVSFTGCANHPPLERPSYDLAKALYAVCNRQSTEHLAKFDEVLTKAIAAGEVGPQEESALREIAQVAAAGEWYDAQEMARALIASQNS